MSDILQEKRELSGERLQRAVTKFLEDLKEQFIEKQVSRELLQTERGYDQEHIDSLRTSRTEEFVESLKNLEMNLLSQQPLWADYVGNQIFDNVIDYDVPGLAFRIKFTLSFCEEGVFVARIDEIVDSTHVTEEDIIHNFDPDTTFEDVDPMSEYGKKLQAISGIRSGEIFPMNEFFEPYTAHYDEEEYDGGRGSIYADNERSVEH